MGRKVLTTTTTTMTIMKYWEKTTNKKWTTEGWRRKITEATEEEGDGWRDAVFSILIEGQNRKVFNVFLFRLMLPALPPAVFSKCFILPKLLFWNSKRKCILKYSEMYFTFWNRHSKRKKKMQKPTRKM